MPQPGIGRWIGGLALVPALLTLGCADRPTLSRSGYAGVELDPPAPKPEFVLTDTRGAPFDFRARTAGYLTLLFFGYTHCPDVCPVHMANLAAVLNRLPDEISRRVRVVFVTTDPARDTPERLSTWLGKFDADFVGLTGSPDELDRAQVAAGVTPARPDSAGGTDYGVGHAAQVMAYTPDGLGRVVYPAGTRQVDWAHDIPMLVRVGAGS